MTDVKKDFEKKFLDNNLIEKFSTIEKVISKDKGSFCLFAIVQRENSTLWDLIVSATWLSSKEYKKMTDYLSNSLYEYLGKIDLNSISRIVILEPKEPFVKEINNALKIEHSTVYIENSVIGSIHINKAIIFSSVKAPISKKL